MENKGRKDKKINLRKEGVPPQILRGFKRVKYDFNSVVEFNSDFLIKKLCCSDGVVEFITTLVYIKMNFHYRRKTFYMRGLQEVVFSKRPVQHSYGRTCYVSRIELD